MCVRVCVQNAEVTRQMTVARAAQDEVDAVRREMQEKVKAAQEVAGRQVSATSRSFSMATRTMHDSNNEATVGI